MQASGARSGSIGKASYEAVRKHIEEGKKATEAFRLVAEATGRSAATVQTAYYRVARSLPDGGGVQRRPRKKASRRGAQAAGSSASGARRGRPRASASPASGTAASVARQLSAAAAALVDHITRLEGELAAARKDSGRLAEIERALGR